MKYILITIIALLISSQTFAQEFSFEGWGATGFIFTNKNMLNGYNQKTYYEGKFQSTIKINNKIEAQMDFRGDSEENEVKLKEFSVKLEFWKYFRIKIGNLKKPFGFEQLINREKLLSTERTLLHQSVAELGFGGREFSIMGYYKYSEKRPEHPYSYFISVSKDNSLSFSGNARFIYHNDFLDYGISYMYYNQGGEEPIGSHGFSIDVSRKRKKYSTAIELVYVNDPIENVRRRLRNLDENVYTFGAKVFASYEFDIDSEYFKKIEPILVAGYLIPNTEISESNTIQAIVGANLYLHKYVSIRLQGDLRLTKNEYNDSYNTKESRGVLEVLVRF